MPLGRFIHLFFSLPGGARTPRRAGEGGLTWPQRSPCKTHSNIITHTVVTKCAAPPFVSLFQQAAHSQVRTTLSLWQRPIFSNWRGELVRILSSVRARASTCACTSIFHVEGEYIVQKLKQRRTWLVPQSAAHSCTLHLPSPILSFYSSREHHHSFPSDSVLLSIRSSQSLSMVFLIRHQAV